MTLRILLALMILLPAFVLFACEGDSIPDEDWDTYDDVFEGPGPDENEEARLLYFKFDYPEAGVVDGVVEGYFFADMKGTFSAGDDRILVNLESTFRSNGCSGMTRVTFSGFIEGSSLSGILDYSGCEIFQFYYEGERVGGTGGIAGDSE